ncbi:MAG: hypothetical protein ACRCXZ_09370 [Patescibacteria group bacterium]
MKDLYSVINKFLIKFKPNAIRLDRSQNKLIGFKHCKIFNRLGFVKKMFEVNDKQNVFASELNYCIISYMRKNYYELTISEKFIITVLHAPFHIVWSNPKHFSNFEEFAIDLLILKCFFQGVIDEGIFNEAILALFNIHCVCVSNSQNYLDTAIELVDYLFFELFGLVREGFQIENKLQFIENTKTPSNPAYVDSLINGRLVIVFSTTVEQKMFDNFLQDSELNQSVKSLIETEVNF